MLLGALLLLLMRVPMTGDAWIRLSLIIATGILYFGTFLSIAVAVSTLTVRSSDSFVILLVIWIFAVLIIPRSAILIAGRAVDVPSVDEIGAKKARLNQQLWAEDRTAMSRFKPTTIGEPGKMMEEFQKFMGSIADEREKKMNALSSQLLEQRTNAQGTQQSLALGLARVSPAGSFSLAAATLAGTSLLLEERYRTEAKAYQETFGKFMLAKTGMNPGGGMMFRMITDNGVKPKPIDPRELPPFLYRPLTLQDVLPGAVADMGLLALFCLVFIAVAHAAFMRYDLR
jgi:ABC-type transport system involved in multi-copper enzyme maturation permease subunit